MSKASQVLRKLEEALDAVTEVNAPMARVVRGGKVVRKRVAPEGYKMVDGHPVKMTPQERLARHRAAIKANRHGKAARAKSLKRSLRKRAAAGL